MADISDYAKLAFGKARKLFQKPAVLPAVGTKAPEFECKAHDGRTFRLSDLRGRKVLLWFYPKADTPGCTIEGKSLCSSFDDFEKRGVQILGCSFDGPAENKAFAEKFGFQFPLLCDTQRKLGMAYGACTSPTAGFPDRISFLIDENGVIIGSIPKVNPSTHTEEMLAKLR
jgi:peroxiredoxin Q/BCP